MPLPIEQVNMNWLARHIFCWTFAILQGTLGAGASDNLFLCVRSDGHVRVENDIQRASCESCSNSGELSHDGQSVDPIRKSCNDIPLLSSVADGGHFKQQSSGGWNLAQSMLFVESNPFVARVHVSFNYCRFPHVPLSRGDSLASLGTTILQL
jgi:hypothetical protein